MRFASSDRFTNSRGVFDRQLRFNKMLLAVTGSAICLIFGAITGAARAAHGDALVVAQAMVPPTGMEDAKHPMPMNERMNRRFPQPVRVGDLIGLPVLDNSMSTLGHVRQVVRTQQGNVELIVSYSKWFGWFGWFGRPVAVPIEAVGIEGRQVASLDMPPSEYAAAPTWQGTDATVLPNDVTIRIALARN